MINVVYWFTVSLVLTSLLTCNWASVSPSKFCNSTSLLWALLSYKKKTSVNLRTRDLALTDLFYSIRALMCHQFSINCLQHNRNESLESMHGVSAGWGLTVHKGQSAFEKERPYSRNAHHLKTNSQQNLLYERSNHTRPFKTRRKELTPLTCDTAAPGLNRVNRYLRAEKYSPLIQSKNGQKTCTWMQ